MLKSKYLEAVLTGKKRISIRRRTRLKPGDLFFIHSKGLVWGVARVEKIEKVRKSEIGHSHAELEGMGLEELKRELDSLYGRRDTTLYIIHFTLLEKFDRPFEPEKKFYGHRSPREIAIDVLKRGLFRHDPEGEKILRLVAQTGSIRKAALLLGGLSKRRKVRAVLRRAAELLAQEEMEGAG